MDAYDVIIIGTGAGGGTMARHLAPSGKKILLLERGDWLPREPQNWSAADVFADGRYSSDDTWFEPLDWATLTLKFDDAGKFVSGSFSFPGIKPAAVIRD